MIAVLATAAYAGGTKQPLPLHVTDPTSRVQSEGVIRDTDGDGCWDEVSGTSASGARFSYRVVDGLCHSTLQASLKATIVSGSLEADEYAITITEIGTDKVVGVLIKDRDTRNVAFIPSSVTLAPSKSLTTETPAAIGIQMSVDGDQALIAVPKSTEASVKLVHADGQAVPLYVGELSRGMTTITLPADVNSGEYVLSVVTDRESQSVAFTLQR
ncbi:MAG: hypothetical protein J5I53_01415 [Bradyrhizobiaceae bacterium]|nr:hypothetical protein [Bradyrhizobiaceae bacterium]